MLVVRGLGGAKIFDLTDPLPSRLHCVAGSSLRYDLKGGLERRIGIKLSICLVPPLPPILRPALHIPVLQLSNHGGTY